MRFFVVLIVSFSLFFLWKTGNQTHENSREIVLSEIVNSMENKGETLDEVEQTSMAELLCFFWVGETEKVNCKSGRELEIEKFNQNSLDKLKESFSSISYYKLNTKKNYTKESIYIKGVNYSNEKIKKLRFIRERLGNSEKYNLSVETLKISLDYKIKSASKQLFVIKEYLTESDNLKVEDYKRLFNLLLFIEGYKYSPDIGEFKKIIWDISRVLDKSNNFVGKTNLKNFFINFLFFSVVILPIFVVFFVGSSVNLYSNFCLFLSTVFMSLGILFTADASTNYGQTSIFFEINPLGNQITRQSVILFIGYTTLLLGFYSTTIFQRVLAYLDKKIVVTCFLGIFFVFLSYALISPALGSEFLKVVVVTLAAITTSRHARESFLAKKYLVKKINFFGLFKNILKSNKSPDKRIASEFITEHVFKSFISLIIVSAVTLSMAALIFGDLGGSLISILILIVLIFLLFGAKLAFLGIGILSLISLVLLTTNKVQERMNLMLEPMYASVSDFARLIGFYNASDDTGYGLGKIPWCSDAGICLPLQVLSDYVPAIIYGSLGDKIGSVIFLSYLVFFLIIIVKSIHFFLILDKQYQTVSIFIFYFAIATLIQTLITFLGNWRIIPLTGLSTPFMSIGISSIIFPCYILGSFIRISSKPIDKNRYLA